MLRGGGAGDLLGEPGVDFGGDVLGLPELGGIVAVRGGAEHVVALVEDLVANGGGAAGIGSGWVKWGGTAEDAELPTAAGAPGSAELEDGNIEVWPGPLAGDDDDGFPGVPAFTEGFEACAVPVRLGGEVFHEGGEEALGVVLLSGVAALGEGLDLAELGGDGFVKWGDHGVRNFWFAGDFPRLCRISFRIRPVRRIERLDPFPDFGRC